MKKVKFLAAILILMVLSILSCKSSDDGLEVIPPRDRSEEAIVSAAEIETFLTTHFYNYEEFENPPADFDFMIKYDTIADDNSGKIPLIEQVTSKNVKDRIDESVTYKLYYLNVAQGEGESPNFPDVTSVTYEGIYLNNETKNLDGDVINRSEVFDGSVVPVRFDLTEIAVFGFIDVLTEFNAASGSVINSDGTVTFENYGIGAAFIPSGLAYYVSPPTGIPIYSQLIFNFQLMSTELGDQDLDKIPSIYENLDGDNSVFDDNTDGDTLPNFADNDDDGDGRLTINEIVETVYPSFIEGVGEEPVLASNEIEINRKREEITPGVFEITITTITLTDSNSDGTPDYLDPDN